ncbi:MAG: hypothetical protein ACOCRZ_04705 [Halothermotrichaceae bacterium]
MKYSKISNQVRLKKLKHPEKKVRMVLDTDTYNEVDDQFALAYALKSPEAMQVEAIYAAPFHNNRSSGPEDGMEKSYGHAHYWPDTKEFNLFQDIHASRLIFDCGVPLVQIPCMGVSSHLTTTVPELEYYLKGKSKIGTYLTDMVSNETKNFYAGSRIIWDISTIAWLINPKWVPSSVVHSPILNDGYTWSYDNSRHFIRCATYANRDKIFADLFRKFSL